MGILRKIYSYLLDTFQTILFSASIFLVIYVFFFRPFEVSGQSMYPTFKDKEYVLTNLITLKMEDLKRGDVIVFKAPNDPEKDYIKRVIGMPGDTIMVKDGKVYVNDKMLNESKYLTDVYTNGMAFLHEETKVTVPDGNYFVMGDNRPYSSDSRDWGFLKKDNIIGKSFFVYWPVDHARGVENAEKVLGDQQDL